MKFLKQGICLALLGAGLSAAPLVSSSAAAPVAAAPGDTLVSQIRHEAEGQVFASRDRATGEVSFLRSKEDLMPGTSASSAQDAGAKAQAYLDKYAGVFGAKADQLTQSDVRKTAYGWTVEFAQSYQGVPVFGGELHAQVDKAGQLTSVNGFVAPDLKGGVATRLSAAQAADRATAAVRQDPPGSSDATADLSGIKAATTKLYVYREGAIRGVPGANVLAYAVEVTNQRNVRDMVFINANTGKVVNRYSMIDNALERELYEGAFAPANLVWEEGDTFPGTLLPDQVNEVNGTGESYWLYKNAFDYDSYDNGGAVMRTVNNDPTISCPNANWNGVTTNYCNGVTSDDTVSHEWGHAYTEYTSGLVYQWQPGAMNEAYSDIWGETVDQINARFNEVPNGPRTVGQCSAFTRSDVELEINAPAPIAGPCDAAPAGFGPVIGNPGITNDVVVGEPVNGCTALTNAAAVNGKFVYVDRGTCSFDIKADFAEAAGATGIIVGQNIAGPPSGMAGTANIPGLMITQAKGADIKAATPGTVNATMHSIGTDPVDNSYRWLSGEADPAFGGAIRDMWNPNCYGDPAKVTDAQYHCTTDDSGGVHTNSGVVNHTFALMVDGGTYNSVTVPAIGLDKAANLFWQAQTAHLGPISDFAVLADSLEASCTELTGQPINEMDITPNAGPTPAAMITAPDCAAVASAIAATQLRTEPTQCNFQPLLLQNPPALSCGAGTTLKTVYTEDFEDALAGWTSEAEIVYPGGFSSPWVADSTPPGGHTGGTARGVDDDEGACTEAAGDFSSRDSITSPVITMPTRVTAPKLSFEHYVATEGGYDGGNIKVSRNGGPFTQIPVGAFVFNPYNAALLATNPMAGQQGFTGTDGGVPTGSWATSIVDLAQIGVVAGDQVRLRLDMGRDGCGGLDGWYVDNIKVTNCEPPAPPVGMLASTTSASADPKKIEKGKSFKVNVTVGATGATPAGTVEIYKGSKLLATGTLGADGKVTIKVSKKKAKKLKKGKNTLTAKYLGSATIAASQDDFVVKVKPKK